MKLATEEQHQQCLLQIVKKEVQSGKQYQMLHLDEGEPGYCRHLNQKPGGDH